jgi:uncharacterized protein
MNETWLEWYTNPTLISVLLSWFVAQAIKMIFFYVHRKQFNLSYLFSTGGMPSSHSSMAGSLVTSVALSSGVHTPLFGVTVAFALVVMFDAQSVRRAAGMQAKILNQVIDEVFKSHRFPEKKLVELLGHTPLEVFLGMLIGVFVALFIHSFFLY